MTNILKKSYIGDICDINLSTYSLNENWQFINYLDTGNITKNKIENVQYLDLSVDKLPSRARRKVKINSIIYSTVRPNQMHYGIIRQNLPKNFLVSTGFAVLDVNSKLADPYYVYYYLTQNINTEALHAIAEQSTSAYPSIKPSDLGNREILLPPLEIQQKIANVLSAIDDKIELNNAINNNLEQQAQAIFKQIFYNISEDDLPSNWHKGTIGEIIELHDSKRVPLSGQQREKMKQKIYPYYGATSLMDYVDDYIFDGIYLLLGEDGTVIDTKGFPILQYVWGKFWVNNHAHILTGKNGFNVESLYLLFKQLSIKSIVTGAVQPKISQTNLKSLEVIIPPIEVIENLNDKIKPLFYQIRTNLDENKILTQLRDTLLPKLMSGEIDVSKVDISTDKLSFSEGKNE